MSEGPRPERVTTCPPCETVAALCGRILAAEGLTLAHGCAGALRLACLVGITAHQQPTQPVLTTLGGG